MFGAGIIFPSIVVPFLILIFYILGKKELISILFLHFLPILWGIWNVLYFTVFHKILPRNETLRYLITGGVLGLLIALFGVFILHLPNVLGFPKSFTYWPLLIGPVLYAIVWLFIIKPLNHLIGINNYQL